MKILLTGHAGFIGRAFMRRLVPTGKFWEPPYNANQVYGIDIRPQAPGVASGVKWDARHFFRSDRPEATQHYDLVIHLAATVGGRVRIDGDPLGVATNLSLDAEMFNWALRTRPGRIVYYSSSAAYPVDLQRDWATALDLQENHIRLVNYDIGRPDQTYGWAKLTGEMLAGHARDAGLKVHVARPFSGYGEDQDLDYPFPAFIQRAAMREDPFTIWGDGEQVRDFIHVDDVVAATLAMVEQDIEGPVNLCTGRATSFNDLARLVCAQAGYTPEFRHILDAPRGVAYRVGDPSKMLEFYRPTVTLEEGIVRALASKAAVA